MSKLDLSKPYRTRAGDKAFAAVGPDGRLYGWVQDKEDGSVSSEDWLPNGSYQNYNSPSSWDLVNVPETRTVKVWINVYPEVADWMFHSSKEIDNRRQASRRIACIEREITFTVGEGLEP